VDNAFFFVKGNADCTAEKIALIDYHLIERPLRSFGAGRSRVTTSLSKQHYPKKSLLLP